MNRHEISKQIGKTILSHIRRNPGSHFTHIRERLELSSGSLSYQILNLEEAEKIFAVNDGYRKRFYPISMKDEMIPDPMTPNEEKIFDLIKKRPGITYKDMVKMSGKTRQSFLYHIKKLTKMNLIRAERVSGEFYFYANEMDE